MIDLTQEVIRSMLKEVYDPELGVNIVDLGLIYDIRIDEEHIVHIQMTLTTPGCPLHDTIVGGVKSQLQLHPSINAVQVEVVWSPPWSPAHMSEEGKAQLGY